MVCVFTPGFVGQVLMAVSDMLRAVTSNRIGLHSERSWTERRPETELTVAQLLLLLGRKPSILTHRFK